jgi:hypothetical protein
VRQQYIEEGRVRTAPSIDRGEPLVYTEEVWRERYSKFQERTLKTQFILLVVTYIVLIISVVVATAGIEGIPIELPILLFIMMTVVVWVPGILAMVMNRYQTSRMPAPGLYEGGVQMLPGLFVPYDEVESLEQVDRGPGGRRLSGKAIRLHPRYKRKPFRPIEVSGYWFLQVEFLGEGGIAELERRVLGPGEHVQDPPRLVLYGRRGARR